MCCWHPPAPSLRAQGPPPRQTLPLPRRDIPVPTAARDLGQELRGTPARCPPGAPLTSPPPLPSPLSAPALPQGRPACGQPVDGSERHVLAPRLPWLGAQGCEEAAPGAAGGSGLGEGGMRVWARTSSYLRSASSAMCFASFSCISWSSIFSSSFMALFSMTFMPLRRAQARRCYCRGLRWHLHLLPTHCTHPPAPEMWDITQGFCHSLATPRSRVTPVVPQGCSCA